MSTSTRWLFVGALAVGFAVLAIQRCSQGESAPPALGEDSVPQPPAVSTRAESADRLHEPERESVAAARTSLSGRVVSSEETPVPNAQVRWIALQAEDAEPTPAWPVPGWGVPSRSALVTYTDEDGTFAFDQPPEERLQFGSVVVVTHSGHSPGGQELDPGQGSEPVLVFLRPTSPVSVRVIDALGQAQPGARVHHVTGGVRPALHERFCAQEATTDASGEARLVPFEGEQAFWAERGTLVSVPWQGRAPEAVVLRLGEAFTLGGHVSLPDWTTWDPGFRGERRILVSGLNGNLWRPLVNLRDIEPGPWGPVSVPLVGSSRFRVRLEGIPVLPMEREFAPPRPRAHERVDFAAEMGVDLQIGVQDENGHPILDARGKAWWGSTELNSGPDYIEGASRPDGRIHLSTVPPGAVAFRVSAPGYAFVEGSTTAPNAFPVVLKKGGRIAGRCLHQGKPVPEFDVLYWQAGPVIVHRSATFLDRADGSFELDGLQPGGWWLLASTPTLRSSAAVPTEVLAGEQAHVELELPRPIRGGGLIVDHLTGEPIPQARVQVFTSGANGRGEPWGLPHAASADGTFDIEGFVLGANYLTVEAEGFARSDATAMGTSADFLDWGEIRLLRPQRLQIALLGAEALTGISPGDLRVSSLSGLEEKHFDSNGRVEYDSVSPGDHEVLIFYPDNDWDRLHLRLDPGADWNFEFRVAGARALDVRVLEEDGDPIPPTQSILLAAQEIGGPLVVRLRQPWEDGRARFEGIRAAQAQVFVLSESNEFMISRDVELPLVEQKVEIQLGDDPVRVRVIDVDGEPVPGAWLSIRTAAEDQFVGVADTGLDGWASFKGLPTDPLLLNVGHPVLGTRYGVPFHAAARELEVVLDATSSLQLTLLDGDVPLAGVATRIETASGVTLADPRETDAAGAVRYERLGAGHYRLACRRADCWPTFVEKELAAGEQVAVGVPMRRLADLELTFLGRDGLPVAGLAVELRARELEGDVATWLAEERVRSSTGTTTDASGSIRIEGLPHGPYDWSVSLGGESVSGSVVLPPAKLARERLLLP